MFINFFICKSCNTGWIFRWERSGADCCPECDTVCLSSKVEKIRVEEKYNKSVLAKVGREMPAKFLYPGTKTKDKIYDNVE